jgi:predicted negative regulator of RcsB-dependent stress response
MWKLEASFVLIGVIGLTLFSFSYEKAYSQEQNAGEFLEWSSKTNYDYVLIAIVVMIFLAILGNYLWSKRKGREFSAE